MASFEKFVHVGIALDPIHVGAGGALIGRVELPIVREPATRLPKIPGSSLAGVYRTYVAMHYEETRQQGKRSKPYYPDCAGLGQPRSDGTGGHCRQADCPVCTVFGFARGRDEAGGFAGLAAFSDAQVLLFPVPTRRGPYWATCRLALLPLDPEATGVEEAVVCLEKSPPSHRLNLGWLFLEAKADDTQRFSNLKKMLSCYKVPNYVLDRLALLSDDLFVQVVNSNLEVRTSVAINPETGAAEEGALFSYEALPRGTILVWEIIARNPKHFKQVEAKVDEDQPMDSPAQVHVVAAKAHDYLEHLGIGGMGTRGMGRLRVLYAGPAQRSPQEGGAISREGEASHEATE